jgi:hypothetical protein
MHLWDPETGNLTDFNTYFSFIIVPSNTNSPGGDGLSFFLSPQNATIPSDSTGGYLGLFDSSNLNDANNPIVAVEFDTYQNTWDPSPYHVGIDVNSIESVPGATVNLYDGSIANNVTANAWVGYDSTTKTLSVNLSYEEYPNLKQYYNLSCRPLDLQKFLPEWVRVGFSGATGTGVEKYNILSWSFDSTLGGYFNSTPSVSPSSSPPLPTPGPSPPNQPLVIYLPVGIGSLICGVGLVWFIQLKTSFLNLPSYSQVKNCFSGSRDQASPKAPYGSSSASYDQTKPYGSDQMVEEKKVTQQRGSDQMVEEKKVTKQRGSDQMVEEKKVTKQRGMSASAAPHHTPKRNPPQSGMCFGTGSIVDAMAQRTESDVNAMEDSVVDDVAQSTESAIDDEAQRAESDVNVVAQRVVDVVP